MITATRINDNVVLHIQDAVEEVALELDRTEADRKAWAFARAAQQKHGLTPTETYDLYRTIHVGGYSSSVLLRVLLARTDLTLLQLLCFQAMIGSSTNGSSINHGSARFDRSRA